jgi:uncharacterized membrane protein
MLATAISTQTVAGMIPSLLREKEYFPRMEGSLNAIFTATLQVLLLVHGLILGSGMGYKLNVDMTSSLVTGVIFITVGNYFPRIRNNPRGQHFINEDVWLKIQSFSSRVFVVGGILMLLSAFVPAKVILPVFISVLLFSVLVLMGGIVLIKSPKR